MKIIETKIPDIIEDNIDEAKVVLAENIINNVYPLFDEVYQEKHNHITKIKGDLRSKKKLVKEQKENLQSLMNDYEREKKVSKLLSRVEKLIDSGLVYDGSLKNQTIVLLKVIDKLDNEKLDHHLTDTLQIIRKRFSHA